LFNWKINYPFKYWTKISDGITEHNKLWKKNPLNAKNKIKVKLRNWKLRSMNRSKNWNFRTYLPIPKRLMAGLRERQRGKLFVCLWRLFHSQGSNFRIRIFYFSIFIFMLITESPFFLLLITPQSLLLDVCLV